MRTLLLTLDGLAVRNGGPAIRNMQTARALAELGPVDVVSLSVSHSDDLPWLDSQTTWSSQEIRSSRSRLARRLRRFWFLEPRGHPRLRTYVSPRHLDLVVERCRHSPPDIIVVSQWPCLPYAEAVVEDLGTIPVVFDTHNIELDLRSLISDRTRPSLTEHVALRRLRWWEAHAGQVASQVWVCSEADRSRWISNYGEADIRIVPNSVDVDRHLDPRTERDRDLVLYPGTMSYPPNVEAAVELAHEVLPLIRERREMVRLAIVGRHPVDTVRALEGPGVIVEADVPDMRPYFESAGAMVVPLRAGGGARLKILEAMAVGLPVVTTPKGLEGIDAVDGKHVLIADSAAELASATVDVLEDEELSIRLSSAAHQLVVERYSSRAINAEVAKNLAELAIPGHRSIASYPDASNEPNSFLLGVAKSGTTALVRMLEQHPDVYVAPRKEPNYHVYRHRPPRVFGPAPAKDIAWMLHRHSVSERAAYQQLYRPGRDSPVRLDASVRYIFEVDALASIRSDCPDARLVIVLRDPVDRLMSHWRMNRQFQLEPLGLQDALDQEDERVSLGWGFDWQYRQVSTYAPQVRKLLEYFSRDQLYVVLYPDLVADPGLVARNVFSHLGVDPDFSVDHGVREKVPSQPRWSGVDRLVHRPTRTRRLLDALPSRLGNRTVRWIERINAAPFEPPDQSLRQSLDAAFDQDRIETAALLGFDPDDLRSSNMRKAVG